MNYPQSCSNKYPTNCSICQLDLSAYYVRERKLYVKTPHKKNALIQCCNKWHFTKTNKEQQTKLLSAYNDWFRYDNKTVHRIELKPNQKKSNKQIKAEKSRKKPNQKKSKKQIKAEKSRKNYLYWLSRRPKDALDNRLPGSYW